MRTISAPAGFSLLELLVVIVLLGLLASVAGLLVSKPIEAYSDVVRRQQLVDQGEMALRQIARDVRRALPNSIRITAVGTGYALEMVNTVDGARYRDEAGGDYLLDDHRLEFNAADNRFNLLGRFNLSNSGSLPGGQRLVIYNTSATPTAGIYNDAAADNNSGIVTSSGTGIGLEVITPPMPSTDDPETQVTLTPLFRFTQQSPGQRIFIVDGPISYVCNPTSGQILRYQGYPYSAAQPVPPALGAGDTLVSQLSGCDMSRAYDPGSAQRGGILTIEITLADSGEAVNLLHQVHVVNVP